MWAPSPRARSTAASKSATSNQEEDAVAERDVWGSQRAVVVFDCNVVELEDELAVDDDLLVFLASMAAFGTQELRVEATGSRYVADDDERLRPGRAVRSERL